MKKKTFIKISVIFICTLLIFTNQLYASTYDELNTEASNLEDIAFSNMPSPIEILMVPFGFFGIIIKGILLIGVFYLIITVLCKYIICQKNELKSYFINRKVGKIMDRMYDYKRDA